MSRDLSQNDAVLQEQDFHRGVACALVAHGAPRPPDGTMVAAVTGHGDVQSLSPTASYGLAQWTSKSNLDDEHAVLRLARALDGKTFAPADIAGSVAEHLVLQARPCGALVGEGAPHLPPSSLCRVNLPASTHLGRSRWMASVAGCATPML